MILSKINHQKLRFTKDSKVLQFAIENKPVTGETSTHIILYLLQNVPRQHNLTCCHILNKIHDMEVLNGLRFDLTFDNDF